MPLSPKTDIGSDKKFYGTHLPVDAPIFYKPFYLDAITGGRWNVLYSAEGDRMTAAMPYAFDGRGYIRKPPFSIYQGPYFFSATQLSPAAQMQLLEQLEAALPIYDYYNQNWHPEVRNWLPFYWKGYNQSTRYSHVIAPKSIEEVRANYNENVKRNIKKAREKLRVVESVDVVALFDLIQKTFDRKSETNPLDIKALNALVTACSQEQSVGIVFAVDQQGVQHAAMLLVWDTKTVYYLAGGINPLLKNSGAMTLLFDQAIEWAMQQGKQFDFEGSMIKSIATFFRSFGAKPQEYFVVTRVPSLLLRLQIQLAKRFTFLDPFRG